MQRFSCACGQGVFFESHRCVACGRTLGFDPARGRVVSPDGSTDGLFRLAERADLGERWRLCDNRGRGGDWLRDWDSVSVLLNELNRSLGQADAYPFVITAPVASKIEFIKNLVREAGHPI